MTFLGYTETENSGQMVSQAIKQIKTEYKEIYKSPVCIFTALELTAQNN